MKPRILSLSLLEGDERETVRHEGQLEFIVDTRTLVSSLLVTLATTSYYFIFVFELQALSH